MVFGTFLDFLSFCEDGLFWELSKVRGKAVRVSCSRIGGRYWRGPWATTKQTTAHAKYLNSKLSLPSSWTTAYWGVPFLTQRDFFPHLRGMQTSGCPPPQSITQCVSGIKLSGPEADHSTPCVPKLRMRGVVGPPVRPHTLHKGRKCELSSCNSNP
jgi:hypothetical protein